MKNIRWFFLLLLCLTPALVFSQATFSFLNIPTSARLAALGGVNVSLANRDINFFTNNSATASDTLNGQASINYQIYLADIHQTSVAYQQAFKRTGTLQVAVQHANYGRIISYDASGAELGSFSSAETAMMVGKNFHSHAFRFGVVAKGIFSNLAGFRASALAVDLGGIFTHPTKNLAVGMAIRNLGFVVSDYSETSESTLPWDVQLGITRKPEHMPFRFSITVFDFTDYDSFETEGASRSALQKVLRHVNVGAELLLSKNINLLFGYNFRNRQDFKLQEPSGGAGLSLGLCITSKAFELVMSRVSYGPAQATYGFTFIANTSKMIRKREKI